MGITSGTVDDLPVSAYTNRLPSGPVRMYYQTRTQSSRPEILDFAGICAYITNAHWIAPMKIGNAHLMLPRRLGLLLLIAVAAFAVLAYAPDKQLSGLTTKYAPPPSVFVNVDGMNVHMRDEGPREDPSPIVLLHGTSASLHTWESWTLALKGQHRVISLDMPGFGLTGPFPDDHYAMDHYVSFLGHFLDTLQIRHCVLVGNSFGGGVAWHEALAQPSRIDKLILEDASGYAVQSQSVPLGFRIARTPVLNKLVEYILPRAMIEASVRNVYADPAKVTPALIDRYYDLTLRAGNRHAVVQRLTQEPIGVDAERIHQITQPTLILWGREDQLIPVKYSALFHQDIRGSQVVVLDGLGHVPHEEDPAKSVAAVKRFLSSK